LSDPLENLNADQDIVRIKKENTQASGCVAKRKTPDL